MRTFVIIKPKVYDAAMKCINAMEVYKKSVSFNTEQIDEDIIRHEKASKELVNTLEREKSKLKGTELKTV